MSESKKQSRRVTFKNATGLELGMVVEKESADRKRLKKLENQIKSLKKCEDGPKTQSLMTTTLTLGPINGSDQNQLNRQMRLWLNPCQLKPADSEETTTPLSMRGAQYDLWKAISVHVIFQPLVGPSIVTGSICFADLDQDGSSAKPESIDSVKARPHIELIIGRRSIWRIPERFLRGPRAGWWYVDSNESPLQSLGPAINLWTYMETKNLLGLNTSNQAQGDTVFTGPLFLAEMKITYGFANYNPKPSLAQLAMKTETRDIANTTAMFANDEDGNVVMKIQTNSELAQFMQTFEVQQDTKKEEKSSVVWSIAGEAVTAAATALGPWGWLLKGGWWVIRKIFGAPTQYKALAYESYMVYPSVEDAMRDNPIKQVVNQTSTDHHVPVGVYRVKQLNNPNVNSPISAQQRMVFVSTGGGGEITPCPEPEERIPSEWFLPSDRPSKGSDLIPPLYTWRPGTSYNEVGHFYTPEYGSKNGWANIVYFTTIPKVVKMQPKTNQATGVAQQYKFRIRPKTETGQTPVFGNQGNLFCMPFFNWQMQTSTNVFYWLEFTDAAAFLPSAMVEEVSCQYNWQGLLHTKNTLLESFRHAVGADSPFNLRLAPYQANNQLSKWGEKGWGFETLMDFCEVDLTDPDMVCWPVAMWGSAQNIGIMFIIPKKSRIGIFTPAPTTQQAAGLKIGGDVPVWGSFVWPQLISDNWGRDFDHSLTYEKEFTTHEPLIPPDPTPKGGLKLKVLDEVARLKAISEEEDDSDEDFIRLNRSAKNEKQNY